MLNFSVGFIILKLSVCSSLVLVRVSCIFCSSYRIKLSVIFCNQILDYIYGATWTRPQSYNYSFGFSHSYSYNYSYSYS